MNSSSTPIFVFIFDPIGMDLFELDGVEREESLLAWGRLCLRGQK